MEIRKRTKKTNCALCGMEDPSYAVIVNDEEKLLLCSGGLRDLYDTLMKHFDNE